MPTTYTGDKTQTQAPSAPPNPEEEIDVQLPADGDAPNASTWEQAFKVLADFVDWLFKPQAKGSDWDRATMAYRTALGSRRFAIDHMGFPSGLVLNYEANWRSSPGVSFANPSGTDETHFKVLTDWRYKALQVSGTAAAIMGTDAVGSSLLIVAGETAGSYVTCSTGPFGTLRSDVHVALDFAASVPGSASRTVVVGISGAPTSEMAAENNFIAFRVTAGGTFWECVTRSAGVETVTTTAVTAHVYDGATRSDRLRIEWHGEDVADDGNRRVRFYINGALVATHSTNLPLSSTIGLAVSDIRIGAGTDTDFLCLRPMRLRVSLHDGDATI